MLLVRPSSLPDLPFNPADLVYTDPGLPLSFIFKILVKLARVQDVSLSLMLRNSTQRMIEDKESVLRDLHLELDILGEEIVQV